MKQILSDLIQDLPARVHLLRQMVSLESPSFEKALVDQFARFVGERFAEIGGNVELIPAERFGDHLRIRFAGQSGNRVLLLGHTDTVFPRDEIQKRPFAINGNRALGPGVFDMKAGILIMLMAVGALNKRQTALMNPVTVLLNSDEEIGSNSSRELIEREAEQSCAVFVLEPSLPGGILKTSRKGVGHFTIKAVGRAAHAGIDPLKGVNAIEEIAHQVLRLRQIMDMSRDTTVSVGLIQGGTRSNVVPAEAAVEVDVRIRTMEEAERVTNAIRALTPVLPGARLEVRGAINRPPMERTSETAHLFEAAKSIAAGIGIDLKEGSTGGASDGNFTSALGIPTLDGLGAIGDGAHSTDEYVELDSLPARAALLAGLMELPFDRS